MVTPTMKSAISTYLAVLEASKVQGVSNFTRVKDTPKPMSQEDAHSSAMYKLIATASNLHSSIADFYLSEGNRSKATYHSDLSNRLRADSNKLKNI